MSLASYHTSHMDKCLHSHDPPNPTMEQIERVELDPKQRDQRVVSTCGKDEGGRVHH